MNSPDNPSDRPIDPPTDDPDTVDMLAAEFVLGTLDRGARLDVEDRRAVDALLHERIVWWEHRLQPLALAVPAAVAPPECQRRIVRRVRRRAAEAVQAETHARSRERSDRAESAAAATATTTPLAEDPGGNTAGVAGVAAAPLGAEAIDRPTGARRVGPIAPTPIKRQVDEQPEVSRWRAFGIAASLMAVALGVLLAGGAGVRSPSADATGEPVVAAAPEADPATSRRTALSLLRDAEGQPRFIVEIRADDSVSITALDRDAASLESSLQLWMADGVSGEVRAVGLLPGDPWSSIELEDVPPVERESAFAVSVEPLGGSPEAGPTGEVVFQGTIHPIQNE